MAKNAIPFFVVWVDSSVEYKQINYEISMGMATLILRRFLIIRITNERHARASFIWKTTRT